MSKNILVVEDDTVTARYLELGLKRLGYADVRVAASSDTALAMARTDLPDLVLMDIQIDGERDGIETARQLRSELGLPVIFLTGQTDELTVARAKQVEPLGYLVKPVKAEDLRTTIAVGLHKNRLEREMRERERIFAAVAAATHDIVVACDGERRVSYLNPAAEQFFGRRTDEAVGRPIAELMVPVAGAGAADSLVLLVGGREIPARMDRVGAESDGEVLIVHPALETPSESAELRRMRAELAVAAIADDVTGLANRRGFLLLGEQLLQFARRVKTKLALLRIDIDRAAEIAAEFGDTGSEQAVRDLADVLRKLGEGGDLIGRVAAARYAVLLPLEAAERRAQELLTELAAHRAALGRAFEIAVVTDVRTLETRAGALLATELDRSGNEDGKLKRSASAKASGQPRKRS